MRTGGEAAGFARTTEAGFVAKGAAGWTAVAGVSVGAGCVLATRGAGVAIIAARRAGIVAVAAEAGLASEAFAFAAEGAGLGERLAWAIGVACRGIAVGAWSVFAAGRAAVAGVFAAAVGWAVAAKGGTVGFEGGAIAAEAGFTAERWLAAKAGAATEGRLRTK